MALMAARRAEGASLGTIAGRLNVEGIRPKRGARWYASGMRSVLTTADSPALAGDPVGLISPTLGALRLARLHKSQIVTVLTEKLSGGLARNIVRNILATLRVMLNAAMDDGVILANPAERMGRKLRLVKSPKTRQEEIKAFTGGVGGWTIPSRRSSPKKVVAKR